MKEQLVLLFPASAFDKSKLDEMSNDDLIAIHSTLREDAFDDPNLVTAMRIDMFFDLLNEQTDSWEVWKDCLFYLVEVEAKAEESQN